jgi:hypothetical protein
MSFAEEFGHDIPNDGWDGFGGDGGGNGKSRYYSNRSTPSIMIPCDISIEHETDKAYLVKFIDDSKSWVPKSQVVLSDDKTILSIPEWLLEKLDTI